MIYTFDNMREEEIQAIQLGCSHSYLYYHKSLYYEHIVQSILNHAEGKWEKAVRWFVSNSARSLNKNGVGFKISLDPQKYSGNTMGIGFRGVKSFLEWAEQKSYINIYKGFVLEWRIDDGKRVPDRVVPSCVGLRQRFVDLWDGQWVPNLFEDVEKQSSVCIRVRGTKEELFDIGNTLNEDRLRMTQINDVLLDSTITFNGKRIATPEYRRIFTDNIDTGGRLYVQGGGVQLLSQEMRSKFLEIDNESVVELDYSSIHPNICYQLLHNKGIPVIELIGDSFKPYAADLSFVKVNENKRLELEKMTGESHDPVRNLAKLAILIGMNSRDVNSAVSSMSSKIRMDRKKDVKNQSFYGIDGTIPVSDILNAVKTHNDFISENFYSDVGILLQKYDSDVCLKVVEQIIQSGNAVLAYHDSFIVKSSLEDLLAKAMVDAWYEVFTDTTFCKIDKK